VKETLGSSISIGGKSDNIRIDKYNSEVIHINISFIFIINFWQVKSKSFIGPDGFLVIIVVIHTS